MPRQLMKGVVLGATTSVLVLTAVTALAGTGVGAVFNLGTTNSVNATSALNGKSSGAMLSIANTGSGRALSLTTSPGSPPLRVNSRVTVPNLSADNAAHLGGVPSDGFVRGPGVLETGRITLTQPTSFQLTDLPDSAGNINVQCTPTSVSISVGTSDVHDRDIWWMSDTSTTPPDGHYVNVPTHSSAAPILSVTGNGEFGSATGFITSEKGQFSQSIQFEFGLVFHPGECLAEAQTLYSVG